MITTQSFFYREEGILKKINPGEIIVMQATGNYVKAFAPKHYHMIRITLDALLAQLPADLFIRIHRSVVVAAEYVDTIGKDYVMLAGVTDHMFPLSRKFYPDLMERIKIIEAKKEK
jgi:DNA-binding LytR/AlgR family response regulator